ncbi:MAG: hypothetical protein QXI89_01055 [Candidatus Anstonellales archaeon]
MPKHKLAQLSTEFSLLMLISIAAFAITAAAIFEMNSNYKNALQHKMSIYDKSRLMMRAEEICLSGIGSKRTMQLLTEIKDFTIKENEFPCNVDIEMPLNGMVEIYNENGIVRIKKI